MRQSQFAVACMFALTWLSTNSVGAQDNTCHECPANEARWIDALPFGAGQFQHGDVEVGAALLISETALLAGSLTLYALHDSLRSQRPGPAQVDAARGEETVLRWGNWISTGLFATVALAGIVHAQLRFGDAAALELTPNGALAQLDF